MTWWEGAVLGAVQGLTEFLPVSSSGHLVVAQAVIGLSVPGVLVEVVLHVATLLAVVVVYRHRLWEITSGVLKGQRDAWRYVFLVAIGTAPAAVLGVAFKDSLERAFDSLVLVGVNFLVTGAILLSTRRALDRGSESTPAPPAAGWIGLAQALAILPGISRSGSTIAAGLWLRIDPVHAAEFSFILAIPAILGAALLQIPDVGSDVSGVGLLPLGVGFVAALISGVVAIRVLVAMLSRSVFHRFAPYCALLGLATIIGGLASG